MTADAHLIIGNQSVEMNDKFFERKNDTLPFYLSGNARYSRIDLGDRDVATSTTMLADVLGKGYMQMVGVSEKGILFIAKTDGTVIHRLQIPSGAEASLFIRDIDGNGKLEILLADLNGFLYCFQTNSKGKVEHGSFR